MPPISVLIVDDDPAYRRLAGLMLQRHQFHVLSAEGGEAALPLASRADVALVDMLMPKMSGLETIPLLQKRNDHLRIIACSGSEEYQFRVALDELGVEQFIAKPFAIEKLVAEIAASLRRVEI